MFTMTLLKFAKLLAFALLHFGERDITVDVSVNKVYSSIYCAAPTNFL